MGISGKNEGSRVLTGVHFMLGNYACVEGALAAGCDFFAGYTRSLGMETVLQEVEPNRNNVIARPGRQGGTVVLNSHMDVVPPADEWETDPFQLVRGEDRAFGRGSIDAKGALNVFLITVKRILEEPGDTHGNIIFTAVVDEESYSKGARHMAASFLTCGLEDSRAVIARAAKKAFQASVCGSAGQTGREVMP